MNLFLRVKRLLTTIWYLKFTQIYYRVYYGIRKKIRVLVRHTYPLNIESKTASLVLLPSLLPYETMKNNSFTFLNQIYTYPMNAIDWNYAQYGKLWTYNLNYFDYVLQDNVSKEVGLTLIHDYINKLDIVTDGLMPFPISLRGINWIKFLVKNQIEDKSIDDSLYAQYYILLDTLEYNILGNHLLENGFSLLFASYYFENEVFYKKAENILEQELEEQILDDGAHYELSPMYHQIMLFRILDCINLIQNNNWKNRALLLLLQKKAKVMLGWLEYITFSNGHIPLFNDSTNKIAPITHELNQYAQRLAIGTQNIRLLSSGYRKVTKENYELIVDVGNIGPDYIPGHAHSDTFNFELYIKGVPIIIDTGLSTYESNARRQEERSTMSHNTVMVNKEEQSEIWGGFRVAKRAKIVHLDEGKDTISATHNGYLHKNILHTRKFITKEHKITIMDKLKSKKKYQAIAYLHFHPDIDVTLHGSKLECEYFTLEASSDITMVMYDYSPEFNTRIKAQCATIVFSSNLEIELTVK